MERYRHGGGGEGGFWEEKRVPWEGREEKRI